MLLGDDWNLIGTFLGLLINLISDLISKHLAKKRRLKETSDK